MCLSELPLGYSGDGLPGYSKELHSCKVYFFRSNFLREHRCPGFVYVHGSTPCCVFSLLCLRKIKPKYYCFCVEVFARVAQCRFKLSLLFAVHVRVGGQGVTGSSNLL